MIIAQVVVARLSPSTFCGAIALRGGWGRPRHPGQVTTFRGNGGGFIGSDGGRRRLLHQSPPGFRGSQVNGRPADPVARCRRVAEGGFGATVDRSGGCLGLICRKGCRA